MLFMITGHKNSVLLIGHQLCSLTSGIFLLWGTYELIEKRMPKIWIGAAFIGTAWIIASISLKLSFTIISLPFFTFLAIIYIRTGLLFYKSRTSERNERTVAGIAFILWGIHKADYPFLRPVIWFAPFGYLLGAMLEFTVAMGLLLVYFRKVRNELSRSKKKLSITLDSIGDAVIATDIRGDIIRMNPVAEHLPGWTYKK